MNKQKESLESIYAIIVGLIILALVWVGIDTFYPESSYGNYYQSRDMITSIVALISATGFTVVALQFSKKLKIVSNGLLLGGFFTLLYSIIRGIMSGDEVTRFIVILLSLVLVLVVGYLKFAKKDDGKKNDLDRPSQSNFEKR